MGSDVTMLHSITSAMVHSGVQRNGEVFFNRFVNGLAIVANPEINGCWKPKTPSVLQTSLMVFNIVGQSLIPAILLGSILISLWPKRTPRKLTFSCSKTHLDSFRK